MYMLTLLSKGFPTKLSKFFWLQFFFICHRCQRHRWSILSCEYLREFRKKFETVLMRYSGARGKLIHKKTRSKKSCDTVPLNRCFWSCWSPSPNHWTDVLFSYGHSTTAARSLQDSWASPAEKIRPLEKKLGRKPATTQIIRSAVKFFLQILGQFLPIIVKIRPQLGNLDLGCFLGHWLPRPQEILLGHFWV